MGAHLTPHPPTHPPTHLHTPPIDRPCARSYGRMRTRQKERFVAAVVTPATPELLMYLVDEEGGE